MSKQKLSVSEVAELTGLSVYSIRNLCRSGEISAKKVGNKFEIEKEKLEQWLLSQKKVYHKVDNQKFTIELTSLPKAAGSSYFLYVDAGEEEGFFFEVIGDRGLIASGSKVTLEQAIRGVKRALDQGIREPMRVIVGPGNRVFFDYLWQPEISEPDESDA